MESFLQFLLNASKSSSESAMLAAHNRARNKMKKAKELLEEAAEDLADARLAAMLLDLRRGHDALNTGKEPLDLPSVPGADLAATNGRLHRADLDIHKSRQLRPGKIALNPEVDQPLQYRGIVRAVHER